MKRKMYGQKQIFQCLTVIVLITLLNFYRSAIRRDKEIQNSLKVKREQQEKSQIDVDTMPQQFNGDKSESMAERSRPQCVSDDCKAPKISRFDSSLKCARTSGEKGKTENIQKQPQRAKSSTTTGKTNANKQNIIKTKINGSSIETTGVITYIAVTILFVSLIKAAVDVSKHIREVSTRVLGPTTNVFNYSDGENLREKCLTQ